MADRLARQSVTLSWGQTERIPGGLCYPSLAAILHAMGQEEKLPMGQFKHALGEATRKVIMGVVSFLPGLLAFLFTVAAFSLVGWALGALVGRVLRAIGFDTRLRNRGFTSLAEWSPKDSPTALAEKSVTWFMILLGWVVGLSALGAGVNSTIVLGVVESLPRLATALVLIGLGNLLARFLARAVLISAVNKQVQSARLLSAAVHWLVMVLVIAMVFEHLRIGAEIVRLAFAILFGGIVLAAALAVGLGSREVVRRSWESQVRNPTEGESDKQHVRHL